MVFLNSHSLVVAALAVASASAAFTPSRSSRAWSTTRLHVATDPSKTGKDAAADDFTAKIFNEEETKLDSSTSDPDFKDIAEWCNEHHQECPLPPFSHVMAANRAEIAVRIMRAATELNCATVAMYCHEDRYSQHRWGADQSFLLEKKSEESTPISTYLDIKQIIKIAKEANVDAIHPGYGFLSESPEFAQACADNNIAFVGPTVENLKTFADKTTARAFAIANDIPVTPGTDYALETEEDIVGFVSKAGLPVILKAAMGGGGKGMRVVKTMEELVPAFRSAQSEALAAFGDGSVFIERYVDQPRHIEVQIVGDGTGNVVHLWERDCSVQRRHQKVVEMAPAWSVPMDVRKKLHEYAVRITSAAKYKNAGTVEFLLDKDNNIYFCEVNPRIQVEHTVTEEVTGIDLVQAQIKIAAGFSLEEAGLKQENIVPRGVAIQCRVTTENPERDFAPDTGTVTLYRHSAGKGVRVDGIGYSGMTITPYFDSMIVKFTAHGMNFYETVARMKRVLQECRISGVKTNIPFLINVLSHPEFETGIVTTSFIEKHPQLKQVSESIWDFASEEQADPKARSRIERLIRYLGNLAVNGHPDEMGADPAKLMAASATHSIPAPRMPLDLAKKIEATTLELGEHRKHLPGWRDVLLAEGPEGFAKAVRNHKGLLITDTTWRDAHQSLLATRMRTEELVKCADYTSAAMANAFSLEAWGGATFDVAMRFLHECPWERLEKLREAVPNVPFQMLLRGANAVGYTNYADNVVHRFCKQAVKSGVDVFRIFDSLNYLDNMQLGIDAVGQAGGFVEAAISYTGNVADPNKGKYNLDYYLKLADKLVAMGAHSLAIKDMAGLLTPKAATILVGALRKEHPDIPIHVHTHDTAGSGVASMLAAGAAGADVVDAAVDAMSGMTSQPSLGAIVANLAGSEDMDTGIDLAHLTELNFYWEQVRNLYAPFESGQLSGSSDVYFHEIPGGQYTNLLFQSKQLGLTDKWIEIKKMYEVANMVLGDIPKVTPSSKVVGDLAQFMVAQKLSAEDVVEKAETLAFPDSVVQYLRGEIGIPPGGFPEPLRSKVLKSRGLEPIDERPGKSIPEYNFEKNLHYLENRYGKSFVDEREVLSYAMYPKVYEDWKDFQATYGEVSYLPTHLFLNPMKVGDEVQFGIGKGHDMLLELVSISDADKDGKRLVIFNVNGEKWYIPITDESSKSESALREKASGPGHVGAPMPGVVVGVKFKEGDHVNEGEPVATLSAMKMETSIPSPKTGIIKRVLVTVGAKVEGDDLLMEIEDE